MDHLNEDIIAEIADELGMAPSDVRIVVRIATEGIDTIMRNEDNLYLRQFGKFNIRQKAYAKVLESRASLEVLRNYLIKIGKEKAYEVVEMYDDQDAHDMLWTELNELGVTTYYHKKYIVKLLKSIYEFHESKKD